MKKSVKTKAKTVVVNKALAVKVLQVVDKGLVYGIGVAVPGKMCVEAAVAYASGEDHNDNPNCVSVILAEIKIGLNDYGNDHNNPWGSDKARAKGLRRLAIAQLGSHNKFKEAIFWKLVSQELFTVYKAHLTVQISKLKSWEGMNKICYVDVVEDFSPTYPSEVVEFYENQFGMITQKALFATAELFVQVLKKMKIPGTKYLYLTEKGKH